MNRGHYGPRIITYLVRNYDPRTTLSWLSTPLTPSTLPAIWPALVFWPLLATAPQRLTRPSVAVTSIAPEGSLLSGISSVRFTSAASSLFGSGFGGSGLGSGFGAATTGGGAGGLATGFGFGSSPQAARASAARSARMIFMSSSLLSELQRAGRPPRRQTGTRDCTSRFLLPLPPVRQESIRLPAGRGHAACPLPCPRR